MTLLEETISLLTKTNIPFSSLATSIDATPRWVYRLARGDYKEPGVNKIEALNNILKAEKAA